MKEIFSVSNLQAAYRKYKSMIYYDTYGAMDRKKLADFEAENRLHEDDTYFKKLSRELCNKKKRENIFEEMFSKISVRCYPKKVQNEMDKDKTDLVISNILPENTKVESIQYQIDLPIVGNILGVLWVMEFGAVLDGMLIDNCFGNRVKSYIRKESKHSISPFLFEPYFKNYEGWRDGALNIAQQHLEAKKNVLVISLDIKSYYYFARIDFSKIKEVFAEKLTQDKLDSCEVLTDFIEGIFEKYTSLFAFDENDTSTNDRPFIPVGFAPSMIIANWYLDDFDRKVQRDLHPIYYGRYVDDFLLVLSYYPDKDSFTQVTEVIDTYFTETEKFPHYDFFVRSNENNEDAGEEKDKKAEAYLFAQPKYSQLSVQMDKFKVYVFKHDESQTILNKFRREIQHNSSEFRYMFEKSKISKHIEDEIYKIDYDGTINKIRSINGIGIDKFQLSKTLSKLIYASVENGYNDRPKIFEVLVRAFSEGNGIDLFTLWEKVLTLLFMQKRYDEMQSLIEKLYNLIDKTTFEKIDKKLFQLRGNNEQCILRETLKCTLISAIYRVMALRRNPQVIELEENIERIIRLKDNCNIMNFENSRKKFLVSQLINSKITMMPIQNHKLWDASTKYDLVFDYSHKTSNVENGNEVAIKYFPRYVHLHECFLHNVSKKIGSNEIVQGTDYFKESLTLYKAINYMDTDRKEAGLFNVATCPCEETEKIYASRKGKKCNEIRKGEECSQFNDRVKINKITVGKEKYKSLRIGVASVQIKEKDIRDAWLGRPNISVARMDKLIEVVNLAAKAKVQLLVMPECYVPYCWTGQIIEAARKHNMAMVFGIEHIVEQKTAYNYLMTVLPVLSDGYNNCVVKMRLKNFYSPAEQKGIQDYHLMMPGQEMDDLGAGIPMREYDLFSWNGVSFAPYNCFELTHINDRALFKSEIDLLIACEDNKDTGYFANIIDSLALDLHCYCVQVNASQYGDSKIAQPKGAHQKTVLSIKGGDNVFLIVDNIDIQALREFQICANSSNLFKPLPPGFNFKRVRKRMGL